MVCFSCKQGPRIPWYYNLQFAQRRNLTSQLSHTAEELSLVPLLPTLWSPSPAAPSLTGQWFSLCPPPWSPSLSSDWWVLALERLWPAMAYANMAFTLYDSPVVLELNGLNDISDTSSMKKQVVCMKAAYKSVLWKDFFYKTAPDRNAKSQSHSDVLSMGAYDWWIGRAFLHILLQTVGHIYSGTGNSVIDRFWCSKM